MKPLVDQNPVGRYGFYCGSCIVYRAGKDSEKLRREIAETERCARGESLTDNLAMIKAGKDEEWLRGEEEKWRCAKCSGLISMQQNATRAEQTCLDRERPESLC